MFGEVLLAVDGTVPPASMDGEGGVSQGGEGLGGVAGSGPAGVLAAGPDGEGGVSEGGEGLGGVAGSGPAGVLAAGPVAGGGQGGFGFPQRARGGGERGGGRRAPRRGGAGGAGPRAMVSNEAASARSRDRLVMACTTSMLSLPRKLRRRSMRQTWRRPGHWLR